MFPVLFAIGPIKIYTYGFMIFMGILASYFYCEKNSQKKFLIDSKYISDIFFWAIFVGFIFARFLYIALDFKNFLMFPMNYIFNTSGFVFLGGLIGGILGIYIFCKKNKINAMGMFDLGAIVVPLGHAFGRIGCFFYGCCHGKPADGPMCFIFPENSPAHLAYGHTPVVATQLIEAAGLFSLFLIMNFFSNKKKFSGFFVSFYLISYGIMRFMIEFLRGDEERGFFLMFSTSQWISIIMIVAGIAAIRILKKRGNNVS